MCREWCRSSRIRRVVVWVGNVERYRIERRIVCRFFAMVGETGDGKIGDRPCRIRGRGGLSGGGGKQITEKKKGEEK